MHLPHALWIGGFCAVQHLPSGVQRASFSIPDTLFLVVIALIVFGPKKLPEISRQLGKLLFEFRRASNDFKLQIEEELRVAEQTERQKQLTTQAATPAPATPVAISAEETVVAATGVDVPDSDLVSSDGVDTAVAARNEESTHTILPPTIQPPSTGTPVSAQPPNRYTQPSPVPPQERTPTLEEMLAEVRAQGAKDSDESQTSAAAEVYGPGGEAAPVPHG